MRWEILDVGCGAGFLAGRLAAARHHVTGVDVYDSPEARQQCDAFHTVDIEAGFGIAAERRFDGIILADVVEHTRYPEQVLMRARTHLKPEGRMIASTGNVANLYIRLCLLCGRFTYTERGILDRTHCRVFTRSTFT